MLYLLILIICAVAQFFLPWWVIAPIAFGCAYFKGESATKAFSVGTAAVTTLWVAYAWYQHYTSGGVLSAQMANLLPLKGNVGYLVAITGIIGGVVGGFSALSGYLFRGVLGR